MKTESQKSKKLRASILAGALAVALVLTGTFAWRSISQRTQNEIMDNRNPGGRVHDDFSFTTEVKNKDVYAENFTEETDGAPVFVRIKLSEYMETGADAGIKREQTSTRLATPLVYANINDTDTWKVYDPKDKNDPFREFWDWSFGGSTIYMPTFNKNKDSLSVDVNGSYVGPNGKFDEADPYKDYKAYALNDELTQDAYYDLDDDIIDEYNPNATAAQKPGAGGTLGTDYRAEEETHSAKPTLTSLPGFMLMSDWIKAGKPVCNQWVYDDTADVTKGGGWFYWPEPIQPQTATGLLLDNVTQRRTAGEKSYYAIDVAGQFATAFQWGDKSGRTDEEKGFYLNGFSDAAKELMDQAASVEVGKDGKWYLPQGEDDVGVYKEILNDAGDLGELVCAGEDKLIGTADDRTNVVHVDGGFTIDGTTYCEYYLKPSATELCYRANLPTGKLGSDTDTRFWVINGAFPDGTLTTKPVTSLLVTSKDNADQVKQAETLQFSAAVTTADSALTKDVIWSLAGNQDKTGTTISDAGLLTVGSEDAGTKLTVTATSKLDRRVSDSATVTVVDDKTIVLDGIEYYVLATQSSNNRALVLTKNVQAKKIMDPVGTTHWPQTELFYWLNDTASGWISDKPDLRGVAIMETTKTRNAHNGTGWEASTGKVFLLSEADIFGTFNAGNVQTNDYTAGSKLDAPTDGWGVSDGGTTVNWWLRSPHNNFQSAALVNTNAKLGYHIRTGNASVRPAAWVMLNGVSITADLRSSGVVPGSKLQLAATVVKNMQPAKDQRVTWSVAGGTGRNTEIDANGLLTVASDETAQTLTVTAKSADGSLVGTKTVLVGSVLTLDNIDFYVLRWEDDRALLLSKQALEQMAMDGTNTTPWVKSSLHQYISYSWPNGKTTIQSKAIDTTLATRVDNTSDQWDWTTTKVFLLSQGDVFGTQFRYDVTNGTYGDDPAQPYDYTIRGTKLTPPVGADGWKATFKTNNSATWWWLRTPRSKTGESATAVDVGGALNYGARSTSNGGVRPAMWISLK